MIARLKASGFLVRQRGEGPEAWSLADRQALVIDGQASASVAVVLTVAPKVASDWIAQASLALAASEACLDCGLQLRNDLWLLWRYYDEFQDDDALSQGVMMQLAIARFLETQPLKSLDCHSASLIGRIV